MLQRCANDALLDLHVHRVAEALAQKAQKHTLDALLAPLLDALLAPLLDALLPSLLDALLASLFDQALCSGHDDVLGLRSDLAFQKSLKLRGFNVFADLQNVPQHQRQRLESVWRTKSCGFGIIREPTVGTERDEGKLDAPELDSSGRSLQL
ncbi:MAG TPA: hypothetical protein VGD80_32315 [Kofleriaceae bacterium]